MKLAYKVSFAFLAVALLIAVSASFVLLEKNTELKDDKEAAETHLSMYSMLGDGQVAVQSGINEIKDLSADLALELGQTGLNGTSARAAINETLAASPFIIDILTYNTTATILAVEPNEYRNIEGLVFDDVWTVKILNTKMPVMSDTFSAREGVRGSGYASPVFDADGEFIGVVSILFDVAAMMGSELSELTDGTGFAWFAMQLDGTDIYDTDETQIGLNSLTDPAYVNFTELIDTAHRAQNEPNGYGTYSFVIDLDTQQIVSKETCWTTVGADGVQWRLFLVNSL